jgi:hypothetical protein
MTAADAGQAQRFFFVHVMKTAGSALRSRLINHFGEAAVYPSEGLDGTDPDLYVSADLLRERLEARGDQIRVITGHFPIRTVDLIEGHVTTVTLLREPVARTLSYLRQQRDDPPVLRFLERRTQPSPYAGRPLDEIHDALRGLLQTDNHMTRMLSLTPQETLASLRTRVELDRGHLARAKEALAGIDAFGIQEHFEQFCDELSARFGWRLGEPETTNTSAPVEVPESLRARIAEDNAFDIALYQFAKQLLDERVRSRGGRETAGVGR